LRPGAQLRLSCLSKGGIALSGCSTMKQRTGVCVSANSPTIATRAMSALCRPACGVSTTRIFSRGTETGASDGRELNTMANLYLTEQGAVLRKTGQRLLVEKDDKELLEIECFNVDTISVFGNVQA